MVDRRDRGISTWDDPGHDGPDGKPRTTGGLSD